MNLQSNGKSRVKTGNTIIHISGFPGSGKTTLGVKIKKKFPNLVVKDTDDFIQHHTKEGKILLKLEKEIDQGKKTISNYKNAWLEIIADQIDNFISQYNNQVIILVGSLDNFAPPGLIFNVAADYKFMLDIPIQELLARYYGRLSEQNEKYWQQVSKLNYTILGSEELIKQYKKYNEWHKKKGYKFLSDLEIMKQIDKIMG